MQGHVVIDHQAKGDCISDAEIYQAGKDLRYGENFARKIYLCHQCAIAGERTRGLCQGLLKKRPGDQAAVGKHRVWDILGCLQLGHMFEDDAKDDHLDERHKYRPADADEGLLVFHAHVAPGEAVKQFAIRQQLADHRPDRCSNHAYPFA